MPQWAVVAIPDEDDYVWKLSSEKIPHLTILYLGDVASDVSESRVAEYIEHAAKELERFHLRVDHRGILGEDNADVLFFEKEQASKKLAYFRESLLRDKDIFISYVLSKQYDTWTPHLTLGYPTAPAKPDTRDYPEIYGVRFNRIALWTSNFSGPTFLLENEEAFHSDLVAKGRKVLDVFLNN